MLKLTRNSASLIAAHCVADSECTVRRDGEIEKREDWEMRGRGGGGMRRGTGMSEVLEDSVVREKR